MGETEDCVHLQNKGRSPGRLWNDHVCLSVHGVQGLRPLCQLFFDWKYTQKSALAKKVQKCLSFFSFECVPFVNPETDKCLGLTQLHLLMK